MSDTSQVLLTHHLKALRLPTFLREYDKLAPVRRRRCRSLALPAAPGELEIIDRERRTVEPRIKAARFSAVKSLDSFDFTAIPSLNKTLVLELARSEYIARRENVIAVGDSAPARTTSRWGSGWPPAIRVSPLASPLLQRWSTNRTKRGTKSVCSAPATPARRLKAADRRRARIHAALADRRRAAVRGLQPALRTRLNHRHQQPPLR
jgi:IstB-like ATP binding protein